MFSAITVTRFYWRPVFSLIAVFLDLRVITLQGSCDQRPMIARFDGDSPNADYMSLNLLCY